MFLRFPSVNCEKLPIIRLKQIRKSHPISSLFKNSLSFYRIHFGYSLDNRPDNTSIYLCGLGLVSYYSLSSIKGPYPLRGRYSKNKWEYIGILFPRIIIFSGIENKWNVIRMCEISFWSSTTDWLMDFYLFWCCVMRYSYYPGNNIRTSVNLFLDLMWQFYCSNKNDDNWLFSLRISVFGSMEVLQVGTVKGNFEPSVNINSLLN